MQLPAPYNPALNFGAVEAVIFDPGDRPASVLLASQTFDVECSWYLDSNIKPAGDWLVQVAYQQVGGAASGVMSGTLVSILTGGKPNPFHTNRFDYLQRVTFPANTLPIGTAIQQAYELTVILSAQTSGVNPTSLGIAAYYDLGVIQVIA